MERKVLCTAAIALALLTSPARADEGASGLYVPGNFGFGAGVTPGPGLYVSSSVSHYTGDITLYVDGGKIIANARAKPTIIGFAGLWVPETKVLGGNFGLSVRSSENYAWAHGSVRGLIDLDETVQGSGFGDTVARAQLGWDSGNWSNSLFLTGWFPTGRYERGFKPNTGKNIYGINLGWGVTYTAPRANLEFDSAIGITFSARNPATDYKNGDDFAWEWAMGKRFQNGLKVGVAGYFYQQVTADSGSGAKLGPFKGRVAALGPQIVYETMLMGRPTVFNFRNYQEFDAVNRFEGNLTTFMTTMRF